MPNNEASGPERRINPSDGLTVEVEGVVVHLKVSPDEFGPYYDLLSAPPRFLPNRCRTSSSGGPGTDEGRFFDIINPTFASEEDAARFAELLGPTIDSLVELRVLTLRSDAQKP